MNDRVSFGNSSIQNICSLYNYSLLSFLGQNTEKNAQFLPLFDQYFRPCTEPGKVSLKYFLHFCPGMWSLGTKKRCFCIFYRNFSFAFLAKTVALHTCYMDFPLFSRFFYQNFTAKNLESIGVRDGMGGQGQYRVGRGSIEWAGAVSAVPLPKSDFQHIKKAF